MEFDGFRWFCQNRSQLNKKAVRSSGGCGNASPVLMGSGKIVNCETETSWVKFVNKLTMEMLFIVIRMFHSTSGFKS